MKTETNKTQVAGQTVARNNYEPVTHKFDQLKMYFGEPFDVGNGIVIHQPTVGDILEVGEEDFYGTLYVFIANPTTYRLQLWDMGIDWNKIKSYELFGMLVKVLSQKYHIFFLEMWIFLLLTYIQKLRLRQMKMVRKYLRLSQLCITRIQKWN